MVVLQKKDLLWRLLSFSCHHKALSAAAVHALMHFNLRVCPSTLVEPMDLAAGSQSRSQGLDVESTGFNLSSATGLAWP